jgi:hypothetical protein
MNRYAFARTLQFLGLIVLPVAIMLEVNDKVSLGESLMIAVGGMAVFYMGQSIQPKR